jgi:hypothetical protein
MQLHDLKGVEAKEYIKCIDMEANYLGKLPSKFFKNEELAIIGIGSNTYNMSGNSELKKVFLNKKTFNDFLILHKITNKI